jgi:antitoxin HigA-1
MKQPDAKTKVQHPGATLYCQFMKPLGLSPHRLAKELRLGSSRINQIVNEQRAISTDTALRLARLFGTTAQYWINLQAEYEIQTQGEQISTELDAIRPFPRKELNLIDSSVFSVSVAPDSREIEAEAQSTIKEVSEMPKELKQIYDLLTDSTTHFDIICEKSGKPVGEILAALTLLELDELIQRDPGDLYSRSSPHARSRQATQKRIV